MDLNEFFTASENLFNKKEKSQPEGIYKEKLAFVIGNEYIVRLLPYLKENDVAKTIVPFQTYAWKSILDGRWTYVLSPKSWGEKCPITEFYFRAKNENAPGTPELLDRLSYKEGAYYNVYVVSDPVNPENNGTVKILQASKQLNTVIRDAAGIDKETKAKFKEEYDIDNMQTAMFDLSPNGINLCIRVQEQANYANYKASSFINRKRNLGLSKEEIDAIHEQVFDLTTYDRRLSNEEIQELFGSTFLGLRTKSTITKQVIKETPVINNEEVTEHVSAASNDKSDMSLEDLEEFLKEQSNKNE